jgi:hypothetical protein
VKWLIVFIAVAMLALFSLSFQSDRNRMAAAEYYLKDLAEECALGASIIMREGGAGEQAKGYADDELAAGLAHAPFAASGGGYDFALTESDGTLTVAVEVDTEDFFRLTPFSVDRLRASATSTVWPIS